MRLAWVAFAAGCAFHRGEAPLDVRADGVADSPRDGGDASATGPWRKSITIHGATISAALADFPVWIDLSDDDLAAHALAAGNDIYFTDAGAAALDHEIERWDPSAHRLLAWVRLPALSPGTDATIYVAYGDAARAAAPNPRGVFSSSFAAVWHLDDSLATTAIAEATGTHAGTASMLAPAAQVAAQLGGGIAFDGATGSSIAFTNPLTGAMPHTITAWVSQLPAMQGSSIIAVGTGSTDTARFLYGHESLVAGPAPIYVGQGGDDYPVTGTDIENAGWTFLAWTLEGSNKLNHVFANGVELTPAAGRASTNAANTTGTTGFIGLSLAGFSFAPMNGIIDEVRIATVVRSPAWIATEYANQHSPATFYMVGAEEYAP